MYLSLNHNAIANSIATEALTFQTKTGLISSGQTDYSREYRPDEGAMLPAHREGQGKNENFDCREKPKIKKVKGTEKMFISGLEEKLKYNL